MDPLARALVIRLVVDEVMDAAVVRLLAAPLRVDPSESGPPAGGPWGEEVELHLFVRSTLGRSSVIGPGDERRGYRGFQDHLWACIAKALEQAWPPREGAVFHAGFFTPAAKDAAQVPRPDPEAPVRAVRVDDQESTKAALKRLYADALQGRQVRDAAPDAERE